MTRPTSADEIFKQLKAPFHSNDIEWKLGNKNQEGNRARALPYLKFQAVVDRLDAVLGEMNWDNTYVSGPAGGVVCRLTLNIGGVRLCKENGAGNTDREGVKGGLSDALKRAAVMFGVGRYLHSYTAIAVDVDSVGRFTAPALPDEFLPADEVEQRRKDYEAYEAEAAATAAANASASTTAANASSTAMAGTEAAPEGPAAAAVTVEATVDEKVETSAKTTRSRSTAKSTPAATAEPTPAAAVEPAEPATVAADAPAAVPETPAVETVVTEAVVGAATETVVESPAEQPAAETPVEVLSAPAEDAASVPTASATPFTFDEKGYPVVPDGLPEGEVKLLASLVARVAKAEQLDPVRDYLENGKGRTALCEAARQYLFAYVNREEAIRKEAKAAA